MKLRILLIAFLSAFCLQTEAQNVAVKAAYTSLSSDQGVTPPPVYVDYTTNLMQDWVFNRGVFIETVTNTNVDYLADQVNSYKLFSSTAMNQPVGGKIANTGGFSIQAAPGLGFTGDISIAFCVSKSVASAALQILFDSANSPAFQFQTQVSGADLNMRFSFNGVNYPLTGAQFPYDANYHTVVVRARTDAGTVKLSVVIDGTLRGTEISATGTMIDWSAAVARRFLRSSSTTWTGSISRIRIYKEWVTVGNCALLSQTDSEFKQTKSDNTDVKVVAGWGQSNEVGIPYATKTLLPADRQIDIPRSNFFSAATILGTVLAEVRPAQGPGPMIELAYQMAVKYPTSTMYYIQTAVNGVSQAVAFNSRTAGAQWVIYSGNLKNLLNKLKIEERNVTAVNIQDYQGEADATDPTFSAAFETNRGNFYDDTQAIITAVFPSATTKIAAVRISSGLNIASYPYRDVIRTALANLAAARVNMTVVNVDDQTIGADGTHMLTGGLQAAGERCSNVF